MTGKHIARRSLLKWLSGLFCLSAFPLRAQPADTLSARVDELTGGQTVTTGRVVVDTPRLADNGHSVPMRLSVDSPMTAQDHVRSITLLSPRNPRALMARFYLGASAGRAEIVTRVRLNGTQTVLAIAEMSDGSFWSGTAEVEVTESACLDAG